MAQCWEDVVAALSVAGVAAFIAAGVEHRTTQESVKARRLRRSGIMQIILTLHEDHIAQVILGCQVMRPILAIVLHFITLIQDGYKIANSLIERFG
jgi:hypothetical protein